MRKLYLSFFLFCIAFTASAQFSGNYAPSKWNIITIPPSNGIINTAGAPASITITGSNDPNINNWTSDPVDTDFTFTLTMAGTFSFHWAYHSNDEYNDPQYDIAGVLINGTFTELTSTIGSVDQSGNYTSPSLAAGTVIGFRVRAADNIYGNATFTITNFVAPSATLPLTLTSFTAKPLNEKVALQWTTADESGIIGFDVERSADGSNFKSIRSLAARNTQELQSYQVIDDSPIAGVSYYRLRIKEQNTRDVFSQVVMVKRSNVLSLQVYPNPVRDGLQLSVSVTKPGKELIEIVDATGRTLYNPSCQLERESMGLGKFGLPHLNSFPMLSESKIIALFCIVDDMLKGLRHYEDQRVKVSDSEVITTAFVSVLYFGGHLDNARHFMKLQGYAPCMLGKSRFSRRLHRLSDLVVSLFFQLGKQLKDMAGATDYRLDSFPVAVCDNIRINRSRILKGAQFRGKHVAMRRYFYGVRVQVLTLEGIPVEFCLVPGRENDSQTWSKLPFAVAPESRIYMDAGYTDYLSEDDLFEAEGIRAMVQRKKNSKRKDEPWMRFLKEQMRKRIETTFSELKARMLRHIHAVTQEGFLLKVTLFVVAFSFEKITP